MVIYHLVYTRTIFLGPIEHQNTHLLFALLLVFVGLLKKDKKRWPLILPLILASLITTGYIYYFYDDLEMRSGMQTTPDIYIGIVLLIISFIAVLYTTGKALVIVALVFMAYAFLGQYLPEPLWHYPLALRTIISSYNIGLSGMFGIALSVSANYIFLFVIFGAMITVSGAGRFFIEVGKLAGRRLAGGAGMSAVVSSALVGTVTGMGATNVAITGPFTIPLMKKAGYTAEQAGGIEVVASTGGALLPPIMGILAFIMAEYIGLPYIQIAAMSLIPAILYYFCVGLFVQLNALKMKIKPISEPVDLKVMIQAAPLFLIPLAAIIVLLMMDYSLMFVSFAIVVLIFLLALIRKETRGSWRTWVDGCISGAKLGARIAVVTSVVGVIVGSVSLTGLGMKFPMVVEALSGGSLTLALLLSAVMMIVIGCGIPPITSYLIGAMLVVPALVRMGAPLIPAHFFMMYFALFALITPPVALTVVVAAPIAGASYMKTSFQAVRAGAIAWLLPFLVIWVPGMLLQPQEPLEMATKLAASFVTVLFLQVTVVGYYFTELKLGERSISAISLAALIAFIITTNYVLFAAGLIVGALLTFWQWRKRKLPAVAEVAGS